VADKGDQLRIDPAIQRTLPEFLMTRTGSPEWLALLEFIKIDATLQRPETILQYAFSEEVALQRLAQYIRDTGSLPEAISFDNYGPT
jgi:hypothetical protein